MTIAKQALQRAIDIAGGQSALGRKVGKPQGTIWQWLNGSGRVPAEYVLTVSEATGIPPHELRPDVFPAPLGPRDPVATSVGE